MAYHEDIIIDENDNTKCELCKIFISDSENSIENHLKDHNHTKLFMKKLMIQNNIMNKNNRIYCGVCEQVLEVTKVINHIQSSHHRDKMDAIKKITLKDGGFLILPEVITNRGSAVECLICNRTMEFNFNTIQSHVSTGRHKRARSIAVQPLNAIFSVDDTDDLWCKICKVYFENYVEIIIEHVDEDPKHVKEINKLFRLIKDQNISIEKFLYDPKEDKAVCNKCKIWVPCNVLNLAGHIKGGKHIQ